MTPAALVGTFNRFKAQTGIVGVAYGPKEVDKKADGNPAAVTFFVRKKLPRRGARRKLADGRLSLPKFVEFQGSDVPTDVVVTDAERVDAGHNRSPPQIFRAGGKVSNLQITGTVGCLVVQPGNPTMYALTNQHIALGPNTIVSFPDFHAGDRLAGVTSASTGLVEDERFLPLFDAPESYIDVDSALIRILPGTENRFSPEIPNFGKPAGIFRPSQASRDAYIASLMNRPVFSYSWKSGPRSGSISHVYYVYQSGTHAAQKVVCFLVKSADTGPPGLPGCSGKLWMTRENGQNLCAGIHMGVVADNAASSRFAMVTEFASLARHFNINLV